VDVAEIAGKCTTMEMCAARHRPRSDGTAGTEEPAGMGVSTLLRATARGKRPASIRASTVIGATAGRPHLRGETNQRREGSMPTDVTIEDGIRESLDLDPRIPEPEQVAIAVDDGAAIMRGTVGSFSQRRAAVSDAREIDGVYRVDDQIDVRLMDDDRREDADIRGVALQILMWDTLVPADAVDVKVSDGWVTLKGQVSYQFQSDAAYDDVAVLLGVFGVTNEIRVVNP
jgi:osmotically-inducible protein OsmY